MPRLRANRKLKSFLHRTRRQLVTMISMVIIGAARFLPRRAVALGRPIGMLFYYFAGRNRANGRLNVDRVYGATKTAAEKEAIVRRSYQAVGMAMLEMAMAYHWSADDFRKAVELDGTANWKRATEQGKGVIVVSAHFGSWELRCSTLLYQFDVPVDVVAVGSGKPEIDKKIEDIRSAHGVRCFRYGDRALGYMATLRRKGVVAFLVDRSSRRVRRVPVTFLGLEVRFPVGFAHLARQMGAPVLPVFMLRDPADPTRHRLRLEAPILPDPALGNEDDVRRMTQEVATVIESHIRRNPEEWAWMLYRWQKRRRQRRAG